MKQALFLVFLCFIFSCEKEDLSHIGMVNIEDERVIPDSVMNMENVQLKIKAAATNLCWSDLFVELKEKGVLEYSIKAYGTFTCGRECACFEEMVYKDTIIHFQPTQKGMYLFTISETRNKDDIDTMIVK